MQGSGEESRSTERGELVAAGEGGVAEPLDGWSAAEQPAARARHYVGAGGAEDPGDVGGGTALRAEARREDRPVEREVEAAPRIVHRRHRGADHGAERAERLGALVEPTQVVEHEACDRAGPS